jgi:transcriptional regulator with XRE-family HTH domain
MAADPARGHDRRVPERRRERKESELRPYLGEAISRLRKKRRLTIEGLAERADVHWTTISVLEAGQKTVTLGTLEAIAAGLGTAPSKLLAEAERALAKGQKR